MPITLDLYLATQDLCSVLKLVCYLAIQWWWWTMPALLNWYVSLEPMSLDFGGSSILCWVGNRIIKAVEGRWLQVALLLFLARPLPWQFDSDWLQQPFFIGISTVLAVLSDSLHWPIPKLESKLHMCGWPHKSSLPPIKFSSWPLIYSFHRHASSNNNAFTVESGRGLQNRAPQLKGDAHQWNPLEMPFALMIIDNVPLAVVTAATANTSLISITWDNAGGIRIATERLCWSPTCI